MKKQILFFAIAMICSSSFLYSQKKQDDKSNKFNDSYLLFELGIVYPELEFTDSRGVQNVPESFRDGMG